MTCQRCNLPITDINNMAKIEHEGQVYFWHAGCFQEARDAVPHLTFRQQPAGMTQKKEARS